MAGGRLAKLHRRYKASTCQTCGKGGELDIHHKDKRHFNDTPANWITLCKECHAKVHSGLIKLELSGQSVRLL
jgi:5-methylcytosine-specific restriction endonuclease McrA